MMTRQAFAFEPGSDSLLQELRVSEERLAMVVSNAPVVLWAFDRQGVFTLLDGSGLRALGPAARGAVGQSVFEVFRDVPEVLEACHRVLSGESFLATQEVDRVVFETRFTPLRDDGGQVAGAMGVSTDVTEQRRSEQELQESERRFRRIFDRSPSAIAINRMKSGGPYVEVNEEFLRLTGRTREEVIGRTPAELEIWVDNADRDTISTGLKSAGRVDDFEAQVRAKDGTTGVALFSATVIESHGEPCVLSFLHNVTRRKHAEAALHAVSDRLLRSREEERRRVTAELHDSTCDQLARIAEALETATKADDLGPQARRALEAGARALDRCRREVRALAFLSRPPAAGGAGLVAAVRDYAAEFSRQSGIRTEVRSPTDSLRLAPESETMLLRVLQNSFAGIDHGAGRSIVTVRIQSVPGQVRLEIRGHDGSDRTPAQRERPVMELAADVRRLRGSLEVHPGAHGLTVRVAFPSP